MNAEDLLQPPVVAARIDREFKPSFRTLGDDVYELTSISVEAEDAIAELEALGVSVPSGFVPRLVEAKHDPAAWHRDEARDEDGLIINQPAYTKGVVRRRWVFDLNALPAETALALVEYVMERVRPTAPIETLVDSSCAVLSDLQLGKTDDRGGSKETLERTMDKIDQTVDLFRKSKPRRIRLFDPGDVVENFDNTAGQAYTNDLSLPDQIDLANAIFTRAIKLLADIAPVDAYFVPSNHCQWRRNGKNAGKPTDDYGILNAKQLARTFREAGRDDVTITIPETYSESLVVDVDGLAIGMAHGHQVSSPDRLHVWWRDQTFGNQPMAAARLAVFGHFHHLRVQTVGDNKTLMVAPTLDAGSSWFTNLKGEDSAPGLLTFNVVNGAWTDLKVL